MPAVERKKNEGEAKARKENVNKGKEAERKEGKKGGTMKERRKEGMMEGEKG